MPSWNDALSSTLLGGALSFLGTSQSNTDNYKIAQMNNQFNAEQQQIQREWIEQMYNQYQSPSALRSQYEEAGYNPYFAIQAGAGSFGSAGSSSAASSAGNPTMQPNTALGDAFMNLAQNKLLEQNMFKSTAEALQIATMTQQSKELFPLQYDAQQIENFMNLLSDPVKLKNFLAEWDYYSKTHQSKGFKSSISFLNDSEVNSEDLSRVEGNYRENMLTTQLTNNVVSTQVMLNELDADTKAIMNKYLPAKLQQDIALQASQLWLNGELAHLTRQQVITEVTKQKANLAQSLKASAEAYGVKAHNDVYDKISSQLVETQLQELKKQYDFAYPNAFIRTTKDILDVLP